MDKRTAYIIGTVVGVGRLPFAHGTWGCIAGMGASYLMHGDPLLLMVSFLVFFGLGVIAAGVVAREENTEDPVIVVVDEFSSVFLAFFLVPMTPAYMIAGFFILRFFDIIKPFPAANFEHFKGGWGVMMDDVVAGIYTNLLLQFFRFFNIF